MLVIVFFSLYSSLCIQNTDTDSLHTECDIKSERIYDDDIDDDYEAFMIHNSYSIGIYVGDFVYGMRVYCTYTEIMVQVVLFVQNSYCSLF